jgi:hypothetical protein
MPIIQREKKNLQGSDGVFVFQASDQDSRNQDEPCQPTARLIKDFSNIGGKYILFLLSI